MAASPLPPGVRFPDTPCEVPCPACGEDGARTFYAVDSVPLHSCVLIEEPEAARHFPRGAMALAACASCGFLFNAEFDPTRIDYRQGYEESQGHSKVFASWLEDVARKLIDQHGVRGRSVVEIGCGKGEFLELLCRLGNNHGVGIDPSATAGRVERTSGRGLEFLHEPFGPAHAGLEPDLVVCRHTLEHLADVGAFASLLRENLGARDALVLIEVPDVQRVLEEGAFWDIYYEHCSYFTPGSLARLFRAAGFAPLELDVHYANQYLQLLARPRPPAATALPPTAIEDDRERRQHAVQAFRESCRACLTHWHAEFQAAHARRERIVLWGSGSKATGLITTLGLDARPGGLEHVVDINPDKHGKFVAGGGQEIIAPQRLVELEPERVVVMNPVYRDEIGRDLAALGLRPRIEAL